MKTTLHHLLSLALGALLTTIPVFADEISIVADPYMPYTGTPDSDQPGFMIEVAKVIFEKSGHTLTYKQMAWDSAMSEAKNGNVVAIAGANREELPDFIYPTNEQAQAQGAFYALKSASWKYTGADSLAKICVGIINNYNYSEIQNYIKANRSNGARIKMFSDANALEKMTEALTDGKIQAFAEDQNVMKEFLKTYSKADSIMEAGKLKGATKLYIAFSPKAASGADYAKLLSDGMQAMKTDGTLAKLLSKYGMQDW